MSKEKIAKRLDRAIDKIGEKYKRDSAGKSILERRVLFKKAVEQIDSISRRSSKAIKKK